MGGEAGMNEREIIAQQAQEISELTAKLKLVTEMNAALTATIEELQETVRELRRQLEENSHNSSKPPSSDGYRKPQPKSQGKKSGKKQGGQKGHPGSHMAIPHEADEIKQHLPGKCQVCPHLSKCLETGTVFECGEKRYVVEASITTKVTEHQSMKTRSCGCGEEELRGEFPENVKAYVQYGDSVTVLAGLLSSYGSVSISRIHVLLGSLLGVSVSTGTIKAMVSKCAEKVGQTMKKIRQMLVSSPVVHFDETGIRVGGKLLWVHNSSTIDLTYQTVHEKRGQAGMEDNGVLPRFSGTAVHDCWSPYWKYGDARHAVCCAHLLRELTGIEEYSPDHTWATDFKKLLISMKTAKEKAECKGKSGLSYYYLHKFDREYDRILDLANSQCPAPADSSEKKRGRKKKGRERSLIERLMQLKPSVCLFARNFSVPFDNNQAERDVRNVKTKVKVSGCFRTEQGAQDYLHLISFLGTGLKHNVSVFLALTSAFSGNADAVFSQGF